MNCLKNEKTFQDIVLGHGKYVVGGKVLHCDRWCSDFQIYNLILYYPMLVEGTLFVERGESCGKDGFWRINSMCTGWRSSKIKFSNSIKVTACQFLKQTHHNSFVLQTHGTQKFIEKHPKEVIRPFLNFFLEIYPTVLLAFD